MLDTLNRCAEKVASMQCSNEFHSSVFSAYWKISSTYSRSSSLPFMLRPFVHTNSSPPSLQSHPCFTHQPLYIRYPVNPVTPVTTVTPVSPISREPPHPWRYFQCKISGSRFNLADLSITMQCVLILLCIMRRFCDKLVGAGCTEKVTCLPCYNEFRSSRQVCAMWWREEEIGQLKQLHKLHFLSQQHLNNPTTVHEIKSHIQWEILTC